MKTVLHSNSSSRPPRQTGTLVTPNGDCTPVYGDLDARRASRLLGTAVDVFTDRYGRAMFVAEMFGSRELNQYAMYMYGDSPIYGNVVLSGAYRKGATFTLVRAY